MNMINFFTKNFFLATLLILISNISQSQTTVNLLTGWSGSSDADHILWQPAFETGKGWYSSIYDVSEMTKGGTIPGPNILNSLRWNLQYDNQGAGTTRTFTGVTIYLYNSSTPTFTNTSKPTLPAGAVKVFSGSIDFKIPNSSQTVCEVHVPFSTNFTYDGTSSLVVYVEKNISQTQITNPYFALSEDLDHLKIRNVGSYKGNSVSDYDNTKRYKYPQIKFNDNSTPTCMGIIATPVTPPTGNTTQNFCSLSNPKIYDIVITGSNIKWYNQSIGGSPLLTTQNLSNGIYYATQTISGIESSRFAVTINITNPGTPTTTSTTQNFCSSTNAKVSNLLASVNTGSTINWYDNITGGNLLSSTDILTNGVYYATQKTSGCESSSRLAVTVNIINPATPTTNSTTQIFCSSMNPKVEDLLATGPFGSTINWYSTISSTLALPNTNILVNGNKYYASTSIGSPSCESTSRLIVTVDINNPLPPTTTSTTQTFCSSENANVSNLLVSGNIGSTIKWYNTPNGGTILSPTDVLVSGKYFASQTTSGCEGTSRLEVTVTITEPLIPTTTSLYQTFCSSINPKVSDILVTTSIGSNIKWYSSNTSNTPLNNNEYILSGKYYATSTTSLCESQRIEIDVLLIDPSISPSTNSNQSFCSSTNPTISSLIAYSSTGNTIKWYQTNTSTSVLSNTTILTNGNTYYATAYNIANSCESNSRFALNVSIISPNKPTTTNSVQSFCISNNPKVSNLSATTTYGSGINWYSSSTSNIPLSNTDALINGSTYYATEITSGLPSCESIDRLIVSVIIKDLPIAPTGNTKQYFCSDLNPVVSNLSANGFSIKWYNSKEGGILYNSNNPLIDSNHYFASQMVDQGCEGLVRLEVIVYISDIKLVLDSKKQPFCNKNDGGLVVIASNGIGKYTYLWDNGTTTNMIENISAGTHKITVTDSTGCLIIENFDLDCVKSQIPQVITPDDNGKNETWVLNLSAKAEVKIFNRWGSLVYVASPYLNDWQGQNNQGSLLGNGLLPGSTYFYTIDMKDGSKIISGFIELIR
jgi:gliding motility-associated-like protein